MLQASVPSELSFKNAVIDEDVKEYMKYKAEDTGPISTLYGYDIRVSRKSIQLGCSVRRGGHIAWTGHTFSTSSQN